MYCLQYSIVSQNYLAIHKSKNPFQGKSLYYIYMPILLINQYWNTVVITILPGKYKVYVHWAVLDKCIEKCISIVLQYIIEMLQCTVCVLYITYMACCKSVMLYGTFQSQSSQIRPFLKLFGNYFFEIYSLFGSKKNLGFSK